VCVVSDGGRAGRQTGRQPGTARAAGQAGTAAGAAAPQHLGRAALQPLRLQIGLGVRHVEFGGQVALYAGVQRSARLQAGHQSLLFRQAALQAAGRRNSRLHGGRGAS